MGFAEDFGPHFHSALYYGYDIHFRKLYIPVCILDEAYHFGLVIGGSQMYFQIHGEII